MRRLALVLALGALGAAGCGGDDESDDGSARESPASKEVSPVMKRVRQDRVVDAVDARLEADGEALFVGLHCSHCEGRHARRASRPPEEEAARVRCGRRSWYHTR
jgi:hypothetical protein